jgi:hypothetical protein
VAVARRALDQAPPTSRQVVDHLGPLQGKRIEVDDVDVGLVSRRQQAAIIQAIGRRRAARLLGHQELQRQLRPARAVAAPQRQQRGRRGGIADHADMRAAIGDAQHRR